MRLRLAVVASFTMLALAAAPADRARAQSHKHDSGWTIPADADETRNPLPVDAKLLATGRAVFKENCQRCHGPGGFGDGPDADPDFREHMNLTDPARAKENSDGVVFYKVSNGRSDPKMPTFKNELTTNQIWAVVAYVQSLRKQQ